MSVFTEHDLVVEPLRDYAIRTTMDGLTIEGRILYLYPNNMEVEITSPFGGQHTGSHVPYFAMSNGTLYASIENGRTVGLTEYGRERAYDHLRTLYRQCLASE
jgi:hypothetical protein